MPASETDPTPTTPRQSLVVTESPDGARIELPPTKPHIHFRSAKRAERVMAWLAMAFLCGVSVGLSSVVIDLAVRARKVLAAGDRLAIATACWVGFSLLLLAAPVAAGWVGFVAGCFTGRCVVVLDAKGLRVQRRYGLLRWSTRIALAGTTRLLLRPSTMNRHRRPRVSADERLTDVLIESAAPGVLALRRVPYATASELVHRTAAQILCLTALRSGRVAANLVEVIDGTDAVALNAERPSLPPQDAWYDSVPAPDGCTIRPRRPRLQLQDIFGSLGFHLALWPSLALVLVPYRLWVVPLLPPDPSLRHVIHVIGGGYFGLLLFFWILTLIGRCLHREFRVTGAGLESRIRGSLRPGRRWPRERIAAVGVRYDTVTKRSYPPVPVVELHLVDGSRARVASAHELAAQHLATLLRRALQMPAPSREEPCPDVLDEAWHLQDQAEAPEGCPFTVTRTHHGLIINRPPRGFDKLASLSLLIAVGSATGAALLPKVIVPVVRTADDRSARIVFTVFFALYAIVSVALAFAVALPRFMIVLDSDRVTFYQRTVTGRRRFLWPRHELAAIGTKQSLGIASTSLWLVDQDCGAVRLLTDSPEHARYLATLLRQFTGLPPATFAQIVAGRKRRASPAAG